MSSVLPGVDDVLASFLLLVSMLMRLDFPTFERPMKAYSGFVSCGHIDTIGALSVNSAVLISMIFLLFACKVTKKNPNSWQFQKYSLPLQTIFESNVFVRKTFFLKFIIIPNDI